VDPDGHNFVNMCRDPDECMMQGMRDGKAIEISSGTVNEKTKTDTPLPECTYERTTNCHGIDIDFSWINDDDPTLTADAHSVSLDDIDACSERDMKACLHLGTISAGEADSIYAIKCQQSGDPQSCAKVGIELTADTLAVAANRLEKNNGPYAHTLMEKANGLLRQIGEDPQGKTAVLRDDLRSIGSFSEKFSLVIGVAGATVDAVWAGQDCQARGGSVSSCGTQMRSTFEADVAGVAAAAFFTTAVCTTGLGCIVLAGAVAVGTSSVTKPVFEWLDGLLPKVGW
jgi:hypothetical protein